MASASSQHSPHHKKAHTDVPPRDARMVRDIMTKKVLTCAPDMPLDEAYKVMFHNHISRLPVLQPQAGGPAKLVGVVSERDLRLAADSPFLGEPMGKVIENLHKHKVSDVMAKAVVAVDETDSIVDAAKLLRVSHIDGAPVVSAAGEVVGIISRTDLLDHLIRLLEPLADNSAKQSV